MGSHCQGAAGNPPSLPVWPASTPLPAGRQEPSQSSELAWKPCERGRQALPTGAPWLQYPGRSSCWLGDAGTEERSLSGKLLNANLISATPDEDFC